MLTHRNHKFVIDFVRLAAVAAGILAITILVVTQSHAAFSDTTTNAGNSFTAGSVTITDDDSGSVLFNVSGMTNGAPVVRCIELTYSGDLTPADIRAYGTSTGTLDDYLDMTLEVGTGATFSSCAGFTSPTTLYTGTLDNFTTTHTNWATGLATFTAGANPTVRSLRLTFEVQNDSGAQGQSATADFTFEAQD